MDTGELKVNVPVNVPVDVTDVTGTKAVIPFKPRQLTYGPEPPPLTEVILNANICNGFGLTQYKFISDYDKEPVCQVLEAVSLSDKVRTVRKMEPKDPAFQYVQVAISSGTDSLVPNQQSDSQMNMNINIADYFEFLKKQGIPVLPELPSLKLLQPNVSTSSEQQLASLIPRTLGDNQSPYKAANGELEFYSENGIDFQQITFVPSGQTPDKVVTLLFPVSMPRAAVLMPQSKEEFAQSFIHMLGVKEEMAEAKRDTQWRNKLSALLFKCIMSLVLGYLYNHVKSYITNFATLDALSSVDADELGMLIIQSEIDAGLFNENDYKTLSIRLDYLKTLFTKQGIASPALKSLFDIPLTATTEAEKLEEHYETIFEMIYRLGQMPIELEANTRSYASILQNVCSKIYIILLNYDVIKQTIGDKAAPIINAFIDFTDTSDTATIFKRLKSIIVLGVAYNSYGWLFALVAPFAIPAAIGVTNWAICTLARLPFKAIKYAGNSAIGIAKFLASDDNKSSPLFTPGQDGSLICVGHTRTKTGLGPEDYALVPYLVSMNDIHALSHELQHAKLEKASLISSLFDASGAAGLDMQSDTKEGDALRFLKETHPIGNLIKCIDSEIIALTNTDEIDVVKLFPEIAFSVFFNTICKDEEAKNGLLIGPVMQFWAESLHEAISGVRSGVIGTIKAIINEGISGEGAIQHGTDSQSSTPTSSPPASPIASPIASQYDPQLPPPALSRNSSNASSCDSFKSAKSSTSSIDTTNTNDKGLSFLEINNLGDSDNSLQIKMAVQLMPKLTQLEKLFKKSTPLFTMQTSQIPKCALSRSNSAASDTSGVSALSNGSVTSEQLMAEIKIKLVNVRALNAEAIKINAELDQAIKEHLQLLIPHSNFIVESVLDWIKKLSPFRGGFKRHRNVPILAEIKQKIVNTGSGLFNAIKPRLVRVKGRKSKRFAPKKGTKKWRKRYGSRRGTKKVYRKRYNTHKKRK